MDDLKFDFAPKTAERPGLVRARSLRTQQRVTCQCQYPVLGVGPLGHATRRIPLVDKSTTALSASFTTHSFMESLILAQDERWRRA